MKDQRCSGPGNMFCVPVMHGFNLTFLIVARKMLKNECRQADKPCHGQGTACVKEKKTMGATIIRAGHLNYFAGMIFEGDRLCCQCAAALIATMRGGTGTGQHVNKGQAKSLYNGKK